MNQPAIDDRLADGGWNCIHQVEAMLQSRFAGGIQGLRVFKDGAGIVLQGISATFYAK